MRSLPHCIGILLFVACADVPPSGGDAELPPDWAGAERISDLTQSDCMETSGWEHLYEVLVDATDAKIQIGYNDALFRCNQPVEAFVRRRPAAIDVLVQPVDMNPSAPARCDCAYRIDLQVPAAPGSYAFTLYDRGDNLSGKQSPVQVSHGDVVVP